MDNTFFVYVLRSINCPDKVYVGFTNDISRRLEEHNSGSQIYSRRYAPWKMVTYLCFSSRTKALDLEQYLKTASGKAFLSKRLV